MTDAGARELLKAARTAQAEGLATQELMGQCAVAGPLVLPTSLAFGGPDGRDAFVGSLATPHLTSFRSPVCGI